MVHVDAVRVEAAQAALDLAQDVQPARAPVVDAVADGFADLGAQHDVVTAATERSPEQLLGVPSRLAARHAVPVELRAVAVVLAQSKKLMPTSSAAPISSVDAVLRGSETEHGGSVPSRVTRNPVRPSRWYSTYTFDVIARCDVQWCSVCRDRLARRPTCGSVHCGTMGGAAGRGRQRRPPSVASRRRCTPWPPDAGVSTATVSKALNGIAGLSRQPRSGARRSGRARIRAEQGGAQHPRGTDDDRRHRDPLRPAPALRADGDRRPNDPGHGAQRLQRLPLRDGWSIRGRHPPAALRGAAASTG